MILIPAGEVSSGQLSEFFSGPAARRPIDPPHHGQGIGRELARAAFVQVFELGLAKAIVEVVADQQPVINTFSALAGPPCRATRSAPGDICVAGDADNRSQGSRRELVTLVAPARDQRLQIRPAAALT